MFRSHPRIRAGRAAPRIALDIGARVVLTPTAITAGPCYGSETQPVSCQCPLPLPSRKQPVNWPPSAFPSFSRKSMGLSNAPDIGSRTAVDRALFPSRATRAPTTALLAITKSHQMHEPPYNGRDIGMPEVVSTMKAIESAIASAWRVVRCFYGALLPSASHWQVRCGFARTYKLRRPARSGQNTAWC